MSLFERIDRHAALVDRMTETLGIEIGTKSGTLSPSDYRSAVIRCMGCSQPGACAEWTEAHPKGADRAPDYCRNKAQLERLARP